MRLLPELASKIIDEVQTIIDEDLIIVNENGNIIASTDKDRVGSFHEGAKMVMQTERKYDITTEKAAVLKGVKPGINLPIFFEGKVIGVIGITGIPSHVEPYADLLRKMTELMIKEAYHIEQKEWEMRGLEAFFQEWLYAKEVDDAFIRRGQMLGISLGSPYLCAFLQMDMKPSIDHQQRMQSEVMDLLKRRLSSDYMIRWGNGRFLLLKNQRNKNSKNFLHMTLKKWKAYVEENYPIYLSIGMSKSTVTYQLDEAYREAVKAAKVARAKGDIIFYDDLLMDLIVEEIGPETRREFIHRVLGGIEAEKELLATLKCYFNHRQSIKDTASVMHIHTNTLHYRLRQIKEMTDVDPKEAEGIALFYLALQMC
ncbi:CdaR family transcriptional regulator [Virgibacillus alimentarius]|uniref:Carbohydrate diacid regulator n=1 Tax=Virgibacillus alimentarius TaxID=698769 RepID=A0ABS4S8C6_9BACI|nr:sugar diacid recognition domain-containing protein [Virgibacillus alimentarius]MBP2257744.1 carbohydrate diacid regulator [Virgibacillus alimentarius]